MKVFSMISNNSKMIKVLCVFKLCSSIKGQNLSCVVKDHDFIRNSDKLFYDKFKNDIAFDRAIIGLVYS